MYFLADDFQYLGLVTRLRGVGDLIPYMLGLRRYLGWGGGGILFFWLGHALGGMDVLPYRLMSLSVHALNTCLVFILAYRLGGGRRGLAGVIAALVFALHPRQHEAVMWLAAAPWPLGISAGLLCILAYVSWRASGTLRWLGAAALACALAVLLNPALAVLPVILAVYDLLRGERQRSALAIWTGMMLVAGIAALAASGGRVPLGEEGLPYGFLLSRASHWPVFLAYIWWPVVVDLKAVMNQFPGYFVVVIAMSVVGAALAGFAVWRSTILARWGGCWALLALVIPSFASSFIADRYMGLALVGVGLAVAGLVSELSQPALQRAVLLVLLGALLAVLQVTMKLNDWQMAGRITTTVRDETLQRYPVAPTGARLLYKGLPDTVNRCVVWSYGLPSAVRLWYNDPTIQVVRVEDGMPVPSEQRDVILDFTGRW